MIADTKHNDMCRAYTRWKEIKESDGKKVEVLKLFYGDVIIKCIPISIVLHESPLAFLESPIKYTITFRDKRQKVFSATGTISEILSFLDSKGLIGPQYGGKEALNCMVTAFNDDGRIVVDKSVDFEGYYYHDGDIHISKIDIDKKHPVRTKEECIECIEFLEKLSKFYIWKPKRSTTEIDRQDFLASAIQWTIAAPFNFVVKQLTSKYLKAFDMTGERDGGKTEMSHIMLDIHGNFIEPSSCSISIYSVSSGSMNTPAKFGKGVAKSTYPTEISEYGRIENYGRNEEMVEIIKNAIEGLIVRRGKEGNRYDALFPSCSPIIINGNPFISKKGEILKRLHIVKFSEEDRHEANDPTTVKFKELLENDRHKLKVLGDWTVRYILEHKEELLLSKKYSCYDISKIVLEKFYEFAGQKVPEWLTTWIIDTSLAELDVDEESIIRAILHDNVHKTLQNNARLLETQTKNLGEIELEQRISLCLDNNLWSWIRKTKKGDYYIDGSIIELFSFRMPDLTLKKLGEKMGPGVKYTQSRGSSGGRVLACSAAEITNFITGSETEPPPPAPPPPPLKAPEPEPKVLGPVVSKTPEEQVWGAPSEEQRSTFLRIFDELADAADAIMHSVPGDKLQAALMSNGFSQDDIGAIIMNMKREKDGIEEVSYVMGLPFPTYRRKPHVN
jgi:hypothetical protein